MKIITGLYIKKLMPNLGINKLLNVLESTDKTIRPVENRLSYLICSRKYKYQSKMIFMLDVEVDHGKIIPYKARVYKNRITKSVITRKY